MLFVVRMRKPLTLTLSQKGRGNNRLGYILVKNLLTAILMTIVTTVLLGLVYPLVVTGLAQVIFPDQANGQLIKRDGVIIGSRIIGQPFGGPGYFHSRPSAAGASMWT